MPSYKAKIAYDGDYYWLVFPPEALKDLGAAVGDNVTWGIDKAGRVTISFSRPSYGLTKKLLADLEWCALEPHNGGLVIYQKEAKAILAAIQEKK